MGATGAVIMGFFGAVFAAMTLTIGLGWTGLALASPFAVWAAMALAARAITRHGPASPLPPHAERVILWSTIAEGVGIFLAANLVINIGHPEWLLPAIALVVGLHFLPIARAVPFRPFTLLGGALLAAAALGFALPAPASAIVAGAAAALILWIAAAAALRREAGARPAVTTADV